MPIPVVWSEREYPTPFTDCAWSAALDVLVYAGFTEFPLGIYSNAEREALDEEVPYDHKPDSPTTIAQVDENLSHRYNLALHTTTIPLSALLGTLGIGIVLFGKNGNLPSNDNWRRWDPQFSGIHAVSIYPLGNAYAQVLDPEAPMGFAGDKQPVAKILQWAAGVGDCRFAYQNQFQKTFLGYQVVVHAGTYTLYSVVRYTHQLVSPVKVTFSRDSHAPVWHGISGFWEAAAPPNLAGKYYIYGHTGQSFSINEVFRLGNGKLSYVPIPANS